MMYYLAKAAQLAGMLIIAVDFVLKFPGLMSRQVLGAGILLFAFGWIIQKYLLKS